MISSISTNIFPSINHAPLSKHNNTNPVSTTTTHRTIVQNNMAIIDSSALVSGSLNLPGGGWMNVHVHKSENYTEDNPVFRVSGTNDGKAFDVEVNIKNVNPNNASFIEMSALDGYNVYKGQPSGAARSIPAAMSGLRGNYDAFSKLDFMSPLKEMMETQRFHGNLSGYYHFKNIVDSLLDHISKMNFK